MNIDKFMKAAEVGDLEKLHAMVILKIMIWS